MDKTICITTEEFTRLKDIETRFAILKEEMLKAAYCPIHHQIILGIEEEYASKHLPDLCDLVIPPLNKPEKELNADMFPGERDPLKK